MTETEFATQLNLVKDAAARSVDPCITAQYIALSDERVREVFWKKIKDGYVFRGISCLNRIGVPENRYVYFDFDCKPDTICLVKPAFLAVVNVIDCYVVAVVDPAVVAGLTSVGESTKGPGGIPIIETSELVAVQASGADGAALLKRSNGGALPLSRGGMASQLLRNGGTLPLGGNGGTIPLEVVGYVVMPSGWGAGKG